MDNLRKINNELKSFINEATFVSNKCRNKLLKMLGETFDVELPLENFAKIDASITEEGNIIMRGDEYNKLSMKILYKNKTAEKQFSSEYKKSWKYPEKVKERLEKAENFIINSNSLF